ncbi:hypothetical protein HS088_TW09G01093 [Tripterygium wilfordii]|uniref:Ubiquinone biosynthesis protein n=1 Tax=Tripterygium wilfordii TaxID=458696 RepID=A0A7J7D9Q1_TRIWF|nr:hypothetical protein HS088_TW09G01093 [Tripterygium wilfordii]
MYRTAAKRLLSVATLRNSSNGRLRCPYAETLIGGVSRFSTSTNPQSFYNQSHNEDQIPFPPVDNPNDADSTTSSSTSSSASSTAEGAGARRYQRQRPRIVLGWTQEAMISGSRDIGVSPAIVGTFPRKEAALVEFFMDDCLQRLIDRIDSGEDLRSLMPSQRISKLVRIRLEMQTPYISKWPQALSIQAQPPNIPTSFKQRAMLLDEIWHAVGDEASDMDWYVKRTVLGGIYSITEIYMLTDISPDFRDTWAFLDDRVKDAFDLKKTIQEAKYLAETVGAGMGSSLRGFVNRVFNR